MEAAAFNGLYDSRERVVDFPLICYNHQGYGNLKRFLQRCRSGLVEEVQKSTGNWQLLVKTNLFLCVKQRTC